MSSTEIRRPLGSSAAALAGFLIVAVANVPLLALHTSHGLGRYASVLFFDALTFLALGCGAALAVELWRVNPLQRRGLDLAGAWLVTIALGVWLLPDDLEHFSLRRAFGLPPKLIVVLLVLLLSAAVPLALVLGRLARRKLGLRIGAIAGALLGFAANSLWSPGDYRGVHAVVGLALATLGASALAGAELVPQGLRGPPRKAAIALAALGFIVPILLAPPARVTAELRHSSGSVFVPMLNNARAHLRLGGSDIAVEGDWFRSREHQPPIPPAKRPAPANPVVVLITVDALRADVVNSGKHDAELPNLARIRRESVWFSQARSAGTLTKIAVTSLFGSSYFSQQLWGSTKGDAAHTPSGDTSVRFPELLQREKIQTVNVRSIRWLNSGNGILRGFADEPEAPGKGYVASAKVFPVLLPIVEGFGDRAAFLFSHLSDPHSPYTLGGKGDSEFEGYLREVALVDKQLGKLLEILDAPPLAGRATLIISADHGEAFGEHNTRSHGYTLYDEVLRVPLLVRLPNHHERRVDELVSLLDLGPTILDWMGVDTPGSFMGQSLTGFLRGETPVLTRPIAAETRLMQTLVGQDGLKVIVDPRQDSVELYDLKADPTELSNLADDKSKLEKPLARLKRFFEIHRLRRDGYTAPLVR